MKPAEELDTRGKVMNASELDGDDIIVGGAGIDKIDSVRGRTSLHRVILVLVFSMLNLMKCTPSSTMTKMTFLCNQIVHHLSTYR